ncbi:heterogeneous nuclear ribonucleoprotein U-like protein 2 isoform X2 [Anoplopoma fimbria]|uniref:heterogeneous nuclear ribonucleoprotein U-like protein 2 isoform X2 n=1 Tax=Anoplopoma fimbria TaxID=229290 RepID=UPI0023ED0418|nr:heterogeneous nuclear ribonucleoprotein U-like protein 2 isoform X2 [Anoplopoma fimbria]
MKLTDIKKLKVPELRSRLQELGLDNKGLKAELLGRLWSALEAGQGEELKLQHDRSPTPPAPEDVHRPTGAVVTERCGPDFTRDFTDSSTQTETHTGVPSPQHDSESVSTIQHDSESVSTIQHDSESVSTIQHDSESVSTIQHDSESVSTIQHDSESVSECVAGYQAEERGAEVQQGGAEDPGGERRSSEEMGRGRAFYEFKEEIRYKRAKSPPALVDREEAEKEDEDKVRLDPYDSHLHFEVGPDGSCGQLRFWARFPSLWSGCRLTHGVLQGRVGFEVRLERKLFTTQLEEQEHMDPCGLRVGWSMANTSLMLGEDEFSFAYDGRGKKVTGGKEEAFGELLSEGDIIGCYASFSTDGAVELSFHKNSRVMGEAFSLEASVLLGRPLFPHVLCKSCSVRVLLDPTAPPWYPGPPGFTPLAALSAWQRVRTTLPPSSRAQCEVLLMVGLPGSGKSHWARTHMKQHPEKRYKLLGTEELLACMIKDSRLQQASQCLTDLIKLAAQTPGNYILDQCNILFSARRYKLQLFTGFRRRVVVVFPSADEWKRRLALHQMSNGEQIPETALLKLQVSCSLPEQHSDLLEELQYVELPQEEAQTLLQEYSDEARRLLPPVPKQEKKKHRLQKKRPHPHGPPSSHKIQWTGHHGWNDTRLNMQPWRQQPRYWSVPHQEQGCYYRDAGYSGYEGYW